MQTIAISNFKGGVGKSTTAYNLAYNLGKVGYRVLLIDLDPQGTLSFYLRTKENGAVLKSAAKQACRSIANVLIPEPAGVPPLTLEEAIWETTLSNVDAVPANLSFQNAKDAILKNAFALKFAIDDIVERYDFVLVDTRPDLDMKTTIAYVAADRVILPVRYSGDVLEGLLESLASIRATAAEMRQTSKDCKILPIGVKSRSRRDRTGELALIKGCGEEYMFSASIRDTVKVGEASIVGLPLGEYLTPGSVGWGAAEDYADCANEVLAWCGYPSRKEV